MEIRTARCTLRPFDKEDIETFMEYRNNLEWMQFQGFKGQSREAYEAALLSPPSFVDGAQLAIVSNETHSLLGDVYLRQEGDTFWIGYTIHPRHARMGYAHEAVHNLLSWLKSRGSAKAKAGVLPGNTASIALLEKLGFTFAGMQEEERIYTLLL